MPRLSLVVPRFLELPCPARIEAMLDAGSVDWLDQPVGASVRAATGVLHGQQVVTAATDPACAAGAIGVADAAALVAAISTAQATGSVVVLLLDSAGARLSDGVAVLGALRRLQRALLEATAAGMLSVAVFGRYCFGGASLLGFGACRRLYPASGRLGLSGPKAVLALNPRVFPVEVSAMYDNERRVLDDAAGALVVDDTDAVRDAIAKFMASASLEPRVSESVPPVPDGCPRRLDPAKFAAIFPQGCDLYVIDHVIAGEAALSGTTHRVVGFVDGIAVSPTACVRLTTVLRDIAGEIPAMPVIVVLDSPGQSPAPDDEAVLFAALLAQLAAALFRLTRSNRGVELWITGQAGGAVYVALAAAAGLVVAWPDASVVTLPAAAIASVIGRSDGEDVADLIGVGVIDARRQFASETLTPA